MANYEEVKTFEDIDYEFKEILEEIITDMDDDNLLSFWNEYCDSYGCYEDRIYYYEELDDLCYGMSATEVLDKFSDLNGCTYWKDGIYGAEALDYVSEGVDVDDIVDYIFRNEDDFGNVEIEEAIEEYHEAQEKLEEEGEEEDDDEE